MIALAWPLVVLVGFLLAHALGRKALGSRPEFHSKLETTAAKLNVQLAAIAKEHSDDRRRLGNAEAKIADLQMQLRED